MKKIKFVIGFILFTLILSVLFVGCGIPQDKYDQVLADKTALQNDLNSTIEDNNDLQDELDSSIADNNDLQDELDSAIADNNDLQDELDSTIADNNDLQEDHDSIVAAKNTLQVELDSINAIYPPGEFTSVSELEKWVSENRQPINTYLDETFRSALAVQELGLQDGYLISVMYDEDDSDLGSGWIFNGSLVNGRFYIWDPEIGDVYDWYSDWLVK